ncbi:hypothetical protein MLD38_038871 [Melastoma candidum]|uniref:Uncharacterized protein n=1 Tax=Melastoma candidum TaxID=119954 RepID=A0ACB9L0A3_9MYRT|nr:hypothetical protein MLD38_038871 [Melastoma candidum]
MTMTTTASTSSLFVIALVFFVVTSPCLCNFGPGGGFRGGPGDLGLVPRRGFYSASCPSVEDVSRSITWSRVSANPALAAKLLRLHFHDCFVRGCDASVLLDSTKGNKAEKDASPNLSLAGFDVIDQIKSALEMKCPNTVSCADIVALAARDAVSYQFGIPMWEVRLGRRDGRVSLASEALDNLPSPFSDFATLQQSFAANGLDIPDLVALSGAHTLGVTHCVVIASRLYNFTGKGDSDPSLDHNYVKVLKSICPNPQNPNKTLPMDPVSPLKFDNQYFVAVNKKEGIFPSDAALMTDSRAALLARIYQNFPIFLAQFGQSMVNMGNIKTLTGNAGEIRKNCHFVN